MMVSSHSGTLSDLKVQVLTFGGDPSPLDDNLYLLNARMVFASSPDGDEDQPVLQLFVNDEVQEIPPGNRLKPAVIVAGKVARGASAAESAPDHHKAFHIDVSQYGGAPQQTLRLRCHFPISHPRLMKTPEPSPGKHVMVQGELLDISNQRCDISIRDITFGTSDGLGGVSLHTTKSPSSQKVTQFDWSGSGKGKRKREY